MPAPTIWIINEAGHPYEKALELVPGAELKPLTLGDINPLKVDRLNWHIARGVARFAKADDYLLISGSPIINAMAVLLWVIWFGQARILQWNAKFRNYELASVNEEELEKLLNRQV